MIGTYFYCYRSIFVIQLYVILFFGKYNYSITPEEFPFVMHPLSFILKRMTKIGPHTTSQSPLDRRSRTIIKRIKCHVNVLLFLLFLKSTKPTFWRVRSRMGTDNCHFSSDFQIKRNSNPSRQNNEISGLSVYLSWKFELHKILLDASKQLLNLVFFVQDSFFFTGGGYIAGDEEGDAGSWKWRTRFWSIKKK